MRFLCSEDSAPISGAAVPVYGRAGLARAGAHVTDLGPKAVRRARVGIDDLVLDGHEVDLDAIALVEARARRVTQIAGELEGVRIGGIVGVEVDEHVPRPRPR